MRAMAMQRHSLGVMARTKQTARLSSGPGVPKPLNRGHSNYPANAQAAYEKAEAAYEKAFLAGEPFLSDRLSTSDGEFQGPSGGSLDQLSQLRGSGATRQRQRRIRRTAEHSRWRRTGAGAQARA